MKKIKEKVLDNLVLDIYKKIGKEIEVNYVTKFWYPFNHSRECISKAIMKDKQLFSFIIQFSVFNPEKQEFFFKMLAYLGTDHSYHNFSHTKVFTVETLNIDEIVKEIIDQYASDYRSAENS